MEAGELKDAIILDVRSAQEFYEEHIPEALNIPSEQLEENKETLEHYNHVYVMCRTGRRSSEACALLKDHGFENIINIDGGLTDWADAGYKTVKNKVMIPIMQQVQVVAGLLVLTGVLLSEYVAPSWIFLSVFVGAGLTFAGLTGYCGMAKFLGHMPWNKKNTYEN
jgi:rhodanese-related sulfurtransferase